MSSLITMLGQKQNTNYNDEGDESLFLEENSDYSDKNKDNKNATGDSLAVSKSKLILVKQLLKNIQENTDRLMEMFGTVLTDDDIARINLGQISQSTSSEKKTENNSVKVIEGVFDGENMIGPDGKQYTVPSNYASKSKLVEGDILKLTITGDGTFVYKQIGPIERERIVGGLFKGNEGNFTVKFENKKWRILTASVTFFKGEPGDEVVLLIPKSGESQWGAVENIIKKNYS